ncbi:MAG TPA: carboxymuconolactone decarboxylase family protein [Caulobacteraceae bacterium]|nr:carboxymuconolactone decarboxylase family protein [Caulobacteraceae bacterium]
MTKRLNPLAAAPDMIKAWYGVSMTIENAGLEKSLVELVKIRASQINGCAICLDMHTRDARKAGESEQRIFLLDAWREADLYTPRERSDLAWTEALTKLHVTHAPDDVYAEVKKHFSEEEQVKLSLMITVINGWNMLGVGFRASNADSPGAIAA